MTRQPLLDPNRSYTFSNYFELGFSVDDLVAEFGYSFERKFLTLPQYSNGLDRIADLKQRIIVKQNLFMKGLIFIELLKN
ncbi:MAG: hypothetical protein AAGF26_13970 [Cyanobacteria bacterium P01_G01_bin.49]